MKSDLTFRVIQDIREFEEIRLKWEELLNNSPNQSAFLSWEWLSAWWKTNGSGKKLWVLTGWRGGELTGIAPLMLETRNRLVRVLTNLGTPQTDIGGLIYKPGDHETINAMLEYLVEHKAQWDILEFNELPQAWVEQFSPRGKFPENNFWSIETGNTHYFIELNEKDWESYSKRLPKKFRYNLRRAARLAEELGPVELKRFQGGDITTEVIDTLIEINRYAHYPRLFNSPSEQALIQELSRQMTSGFEVYILYLNNQPVAYEYGFLSERRFEDWRSGFDTRIPSNISIGKILAMQVVQACLAEKFSEIDFLRGEEAYKKEWKPSDRYYTQLRVFNRGRIVASLSYLWLTRIKPLTGKMPPSPTDDLRDQDE